MHAKALHVIRAHVLLILYAVTCLKLFSVRLTHAYTVQDILWGVVV
jgi:hypothetical protein